MGVKLQGRILERSLRLEISLGFAHPQEHSEPQLRIIKAPMFVIDYLIVHELAHLPKHTHSHRFWQIVAVRVPDYQCTKDWL